MASLKDLRNRIRSVKSTQKITSAMKMVAAAKLRRAQEQAEAARPYAERMERMLGSLAGSMAGRDGAPVLLAGTGRDQVHLVVVMTSDRGLCGGFNSTIVRARITNGLPVRVALPRVGTETTLLFGQPNFLFQQSQQVTAPPEATKATPVMATAAAIPAIGDPAQYALGKLRIGEAHTLATGERVLVAVIDSGIDLSHPELAGVIVGSFDAIGKAAPPHQHGTAIAGAIAAHARLMGAAPSAKILAIRAFGASGASAEATTMAILKSIQYASLQQARIINMSFAGPNDPNLSRELAAAKVKGAVLIAASGNFGPKSPPQYPAADPNVIAVSATDVDDKMFGASNIGPHIAVAAPGVDILLPSPGNDYRLISGTSFSAAYVSGVAALIIQRAPGLSPDAVRNILQSTAKDLGPIGKDPEFGAGLVDAYKAIMAVQASATAEATPTPQAGTGKAKAQ